MSFVQYPAMSFAQLPRNGRNGYLVQWDIDSLNAIIPQNRLHLLQNTIE